MPLTHNRKAVAYALLIPSLISFLVTMLTGHVVAKCIYHLESSIDISLDICGALGLLLLILHGLPLFFVVFTSYVLAS